MCCVFTVLALGCSTDDNGHDVLKPSDFFAAAKCLSRVVVEDESIQSIQALLLMVPPPPLSCERGANIRVYILPIPIYGVWDGYTLATQFGWRSYWDCIEMMPRYNTRILWNVKLVDDYGGRYTNLNGISPT
jgi:hypothetical protein